MNNKGQALVEFVLILPIFIFILFAIIDFGMIFSSKNSLENDSMDIVMLIKNGSSIESISGLYPDYVISMTLDENYYDIVIKDEVGIITPGLNRIFGNPYEIKVERYVPYA